MITENDMVKIKETTVFKDGSKKEYSKKFKTLSQLYKALKRSGCLGETIYNLKKRKHAEIIYPNCTTIVEIETDET
jgi:hypothetical protein